MDCRILNKLCYFLNSPEKLLSCSKHFAIKRVRNIRWKNRIYFKDNRVKIINCEILYHIGNKCKEIWYKNGKRHKDDIDPKTGFTFPAIILECGIKEWHQEGKKHRADIDHYTGITLPAITFSNGTQIWYKKGKKHRDDIDPDTILTLPAVISTIENKKWFKNGKQFRDDIDPETGLTFPTINWCDGTEEWCKGKKRWKKKVENGWNMGASRYTGPGWIIGNHPMLNEYMSLKHHRDEIDPGSGFTLPAISCVNGEKIWYKHGEIHRDDIDPDTNKTLYAKIYEDGRKEWFKNGNYIFLQL
jgi:hypothetical protein